MRTLGIDLASSPLRTGMCVLEWGHGGATAQVLEVGAEDGRLLELCRESDVVGIDAPFGWPEAFRELVSARAGPGSWSPARRDELRFRRTDRRVREATGRWPLSVSSDLIGVPAMRCVRLLAALGVTDRSGDGRVFEVYPAAALACWGLRSTGYKKAKSHARRLQLVQELIGRTPWMAWTPEVVAAAEANDDLLDALLASFMGRAVALGMTETLMEADREAGRLEGWIHLPMPDSLAGLGG
jgi:predicted nuclease with RNAse H fold